jgi:hypothetical protein
MTVGRHCEICGEDGLVGVGLDGSVVYLCANHFNDWLREKRRLFDTLAGDDRETEASRP